MISLRARPSSPPISPPSSPPISHDLQLSPRRAPAAGAQDGALLYWSALRPGAPLGQSVGARGQAAHEAAIWTMAWHPLGHQLCSGANDNLVKFWSRHRPGDGRKREREEGDETFDDEVEMRMLSLATMAANQGQI